MPPVNPAWVGALAALITLCLAVFGWLGRRLWRGFRMVYLFLQDWNGVPADSRGHEARPGIMARLTLLEHNLTDVQGQVHLNGGGSLRDEVSRNTAAVGALCGKVDRLHAAVENLKAR